MQFYVICCPDCGTANIRKRHKPRQPPITKYICEKCDYCFDTPACRKKKTSQKEYTPPLLKMLEAKKYKKEGEIMPP